VICAVGFLRGTFAAFALAHALGCASSPPSERTVLAGNWARTLLILPLNVPAVMAPELEAARPVVWEELEVYLRAQGKELKTVSYPTARQLWLGAIRRARAGEKGAKAGFDDAAQALVLELARHAQFDGVIVPSLFVREARIEGQSARWDGVERPVEFEIRGPVAAAADAPPPVEGLAPAASLHAVVLDAQGNKLQEVLRGLDLLVGVRVTEARSGAGRSFEFATRPDPLANRAHVREGIAEALAPFLPRLSEAP
jgi:hypothetical protein